MPTQVSTKNLYPGINAHVNSYLQQEDGGWESFYAGHVGMLRDYLDTILPPNYFARSEKSLQIREQEPDEFFQRKSRTQPDIAIYRTGDPQPVVAVLEATPPTAMLALPETFPDEDALNSVMIYEVLGKTFKPVTWLELLSPANKPRRSYYAQYMQKRKETLASGLNLVEIDYLHESPPLIPVLPSYPKGEKGAFPYMIFVSNPHPSLQEGNPLIFGWHVDDTLPIIDIPLAAAETVRLNFGVAYHLTIERTRFYQVISQYEQDPPGLDRYLPDDQQRLQTLLQHIRATL
jgi:hypothetical protein